jgi:hypothetical protein
MPEILKRILSKKPYISTASNEHAAKTSLSVLKWQIIDYAGRVIGH